jgi:hypothetical protein
MSHSVDWSPVTAGHVKSAIQEYDRLGAHDFFKQHGYAPSEGAYPPKAILGTAYELATGRRLAATDFEGGKNGAVKILTGLGFRVIPRQG